MLSDTIDIPRDEFYRLPLTQRTGNPENFGGNQWQVTRSWK